jgi:hypothetical protein
MSASAPPAAPRPVVLLHGLARTPRSLWPVARAAAARGRVVLAVGYPWRRAPVEALAAHAAAAIGRAATAAGLAPDAAFDVVTHSMGGIVLRAAVALGHLPAGRVHRAVMLAPPSQGSELAERLRDLRLFGWALGPAARQLGTGAESFPRSLPPLPFPCGVIAGRRSMVPGAERLFGGETDGRVSVARTRAPGMADFLVLDRGHALLMWAPDVLAATFAFLDEGRFPRGDAPAGPRDVVR